MQLDCSRSVHFSMRERLTRQLSLNQTLITYSYLTMKKTLITFFALAGVATAAESTILTFGTAPSWATNSWDLTTLPENAAAGAKTSSLTLSDDTYVSMYRTGGRFGIRVAATTEWTNMSVLDDMNSVLGTTLSAHDITALTYTASKAGGSKSTLTLNFAANDSITIGDSMCFFFVVAMSNEDVSHSYSGFNITGLANSSVQWADATGTGYNESSVNAANNQLTIIKVTGELVSDAVSFSSDNAKNGWSMASYTAIPEPTTATLSLLALAGLAARRRRK